MRKLFRSVSIVAGILVLTLGLTATPVFAQPQPWNSAGSVCVSGPNNDVATIQGLECLIANVFSVIITLIGLGAFVMLIVGSFRWMLSGSNAKGAETARSTMTFAIIGLIVALSAFMILNLLAEFTGINIIRTFVIPGS